MILFGKLFFVLFLLPFISDTSESNRSDSNETWETISSGRGNENPEKQPPVDLNETEKADKCIICYELFGNDSVLKWKECGHKFHTKCAERWQKQSKKCPLCRQEDKNITIKKKTTPNDMILHYIAFLVMRRQRRMFAMAHEQNIVNRCDLRKEVIPNQLDICDPCQRNIENSASSQSVKRCDICEDVIPNQFVRCEHCERLVEESTSNQRQNRENIVNRCDLCENVIPNELKRCEGCERQWLCALGESVSTQTRSNDDPMKFENKNAQNGNCCFQCGKNLPFNILTLNSLETCEECVIKDSDKMSRPSNHPQNKTILNQSNYPMEQNIVNRCVLCEDMIPNELERCERCERILEESALTQARINDDPMKFENKNAQNGNCCFQCGKNLPFNNLTLTCDECMTKDSDKMRNQRENKNTLQPQIVGQKLIQEEAVLRDNIQHMLVAAQRGDTDEVLKMVIDHGVDVNSMIENTALHLAARNGHDDCLEILFDLEADVFKLNKKNQSVLYQYIHAIYYQDGSMKGLRMLVERGARPSREACQFLETTTKAENEPTKLLKEATEYLLNLPN